MDARTPHPTYFISVCGKNVGELIQVLAYEGQPPFTWVTYCCPVVPGSKCFHCRDSVHLKALAPIHPLSSCLTCPALCSHTSANKLDFCSCLGTLTGGCITFSIVCLEILFWIPLIFPHHLSSVFPVS